MGAYHSFPNGLRRMSNNPLRDHLRAEGAQFARDNPDHLAEFCLRSPKLCKLLLQGMFLGAYQWGQGIAAPSTLCLKVDNLHNDAVDLYAKDYALREMQARGVAL